MSNLTANTASQRDGLQPPGSTNAPRSMSASGSTFAPRGSSLAPSGPPGSFNSELRSTGSRSITPRPDMSTGADLSGAEEEESTSEAVLAALGHGVGSFASVGHR